jgi:hypothetical protein
MAQNKIARMAGLIRNDGDVDSNENIANERQVLLSLEILYSLYNLKCNDYNKRNLKK